MQIIYILLEILLPLTYFTYAIPPWCFPYALFLNYPGMSLQGGIINKK